MDSGNLVVEAFNHWVVSMSHVVSYDMASGNQGFIEVADNYLMTAQRELPSIGAERGQGEFQDFADALYRLTTIEIDYVGLLRQAASDYDVDAWNRAVDLQPEIEVIEGDYRTKRQEACDYWD